MPEDLDTSESPFIRVSRSGERNITIERAADRATADRSAAGRGRKISAGDRDEPRRSTSRGRSNDFDDDFVDEPARARIEPADADEDFEPPTRRARGARPMPQRLSESGNIQPERTEPVRIPNSRSTSAKQTAKAKQAEAEQIALNLKAPRKKQDPTVKKRQVLGTVLFVFAVLVTIAILSYTPKDAAVAETKFSDLFSVITRTDPVVNAHADTAQNSLGLIGAMLADFLINKTIGYASIIYPIFFGWWSLAFFRFTNRQRQRLILATTFFLVTAILLSATIGTTQLIQTIPHLQREWSGAVGQFLGLTFTRLIGSVGALIVYATAFLITLVFSIDLDIEKTFMRLVGAYQFMLMGARRKIIEFWDRREQRQIEREMAREAKAEEDSIEEEIDRRVSVMDDDEDTPTAEVVEKVAPTVARKSKIIAQTVAATLDETPPQVSSEAPNAAEPVSADMQVKIMRPAAAAAAAQGFAAGGPLLKVRPVAKVTDPNGNIPRLTRTQDDKLGTRPNSLERLSNGAVVRNADNKLNDVDAPQPVRMEDAASIGSTVAAPDTVIGIDSTVPDAVPLISEGRDGLLAGLKPVKREQQISIKKELPPVLLGDESTLSNEALPHSIDGGAELRGVVSEHQSLAREAAREADKLRKLGEEPLFEEAPVKRVIIPENPYLEILNKYKLPSVELLTPAEAKDLLDADDEELAMKGRILRDKLATFGVEIENITVTPGPVVTLYEFTPAEGVKVSRVENLTDDIALAMKARGIRIIAPIPGRGTIGVEIPNDVPKMVRMRQMLESESFRKTKMNLPVALGKTISGDVYVDDLNKMPHLLIAGATGAGKSVGVNGIIASLLYAKSPKDLKFVIVDPKKIELSLYKQIRKHYLIVSPEAGEDIVTTPAFAVLALKAVELEMERRYDKLAKAAVRSLVDYNIKVAQGKLQSTQDEQHYHLPYIVVIIDELADLMITAAREIEEPICRIAQMARAVGIHMILATQRPSVDVITGVIKANFPARIAFQVATRVDSRTILDSMGAEQLLGNGDMLYQPSGTPKPIRLQSPFISTEEVEAIVEAISIQDGQGLSYSRPWTLPSLKQKDGRSSSAMDDGDGRDDLFEEAARVIVRHQQGSVSLLQRRLKVGYSRAARIVDELEQAAIVGPFDGSKARAVLCENEEELELVFEGLR